jgi:tetrahydromethanopterin S-methyltransferase subunit H
MHWNHRVVKKTYDDGSMAFGIHEVFYNDDNTIYAYTEEPIEVSCESMEALREYVQWMLNCIDKPILIDGEVEFVDPVSDNDGD